MKKLTPNQTVRAYCTHCLGLTYFNREAIKDCQGDLAYIGSCPLFPYRLGKRISVKGFHAFCLQCMGGNRTFVAECETVGCHIHPYRMGKNPARLGIGNTLKRVVSRGYNGKFETSHPA